MPAKAGLMLLLLLKPNMSSTGLMLLLTPNEVLKKTENRGLRSISGLGISRDYYNFAI